jgi:hypothetical protein
VLQTLPVTVEAAGTMPGSTVGAIWLGGTERLLLLGVMGSP